MATNTMEDEYGEMSDSGETFTYPGIYPLEVRFWFARSLALML